MHLRLAQYIALLFYATICFSQQDYNINGQLLLEQKSAAGISQIDMSGLANGIYFVKTYANQQTETHKVIKR
jgi:hypothetical protein